jgi:triacylglycerol lipase
MSILVELPERLYQPDAFAAFKAVPAFSRGTARAMAWMAQLAYEGDEDKIQRICALWDLGRPRAIANETSLKPPFIRTRGLVAEGHGATIFAFAGTDPLVPANWFTDFDLKLTPGAMMASSEVTPGNVHRGFERGVSAVWEQIVAALAGRGEQPVFVTGHSLGAALAVVAADRAFCETAVGVRASAVYCFGMPRAGDEDFALRYNDTLGATTYRLVHGDDIVTTVPPSRLGFRHVGKLIRCTRAGQFGADVPVGFSDDPPFIGSLVAGLGQGLSDLFKLQLQPTFRDDPLGRMSGLLIPPIADHLPDRYWHAFDSVRPKS